MLTRASPPGWEYSAVLLFGICIYLQDNYPNWLRKEDKNKNTECLTSIPVFPEKISTAFIFAVSVNLEVRS